jgi:hypothetical protein
MTSCLKSILLGLLLTLPVWADELILKDGKKIEWKTLSDEGDSYEITTPQGTKITVKKDDVESFTKKKTEGPLTGAQFTFDKKRKLTTVDLFTKIDLKKDVVAGDWKFAGGVLTGTTNGGPSKLQTTFTPPEEYDLTLVIEQKDVAGGAIFVGLIGGGKQFTFGFGGDWSGLEAYGGQKMQDSGIGIPGRFFQKAPRTVTFMVRKEAFIVQADGKDYFTWKADWSKLSVIPFHAVQSQNTIFLVVSRSEVAQLSYKISRMTLTSPKE